MAIYSNSVDDKLFLSGNNSAIRTLYLNSGTNSVFPNRIENINNYTNRFPCPTIVPIEFRLIDNYPVIFHRRYFFHIFCCLNNYTIESSYSNNFIFKTDFMYSNKEYVRASYAYVYGHIIIYIFIYIGK